MRKSFWVFLSAFLFAVLVSGLLFFRAVLGSVSAPAMPLPSKALNLFLSVVSLIQSDYVEAVKPRQLVDGALRGMLKSLDPYSQFLDTEAYEDLKIGTEGRFGGLGLEVSIKDGLLTVISPLDGSPAERAGVRAGDTIMKIDDEPTRDMTLHDAVKKMRGDPGSAVKLTRMGEGENQLLELEVERDTIKIKSIRDAKLLEGQVGYIRIS